mmetsp:Transcript_36879/g.75581  ORF Transcript_36879/g.75581 Transcript_36879/m.75581 type:complete len:80 (-) Transcript_36879:203-442(-)
MARAARAARAAAVPGPPGASMAVEAVHFVAMDTRIGQSKALAWKMGYYLGKSPLASFAQVDVLAHIGVAHAEPPVRMRG